MFLSFLSRGKLFLQPIKDVYMNNIDVIALGLCLYLMFFLSCQVERVHARPRCCKASPSYRLDSRRQLFKVQNCFGVDIFYDRMTCVLAKDP